MSVSFYITPGKILGYSVSCVCGKGRVAFDSYAEAESYLIMWHMEKFVVEGCPNDEDGYCAVDIPRLNVHSEHDDVNDAHEVQMSIFNASDILKELGIVEESGQIDPEDILSRALIQVAMGERSEAIEPVENGNMVYCGREEGYVQNKLSAIVELAQIAKKRGTTITWS